MSADKQQRIKQRAYEIWEKSGRPHGAHEVHWLQATSEIEVEDSPGKPKRAKAAATAKAPAAAKAKTAAPKAAAPKAAAKPAAVKAPAKAEAKSKA